MANVNINRNLTDQFYRYKMPKLIAKVEGKGNGIKTVIVNMPEIAKSLNRPPMYPTKYFGCLLGAQVNFDNKSERYIVNGAHEPNKLQDLLDGFIQKYVLCQACKNPETELSVHKKKEIIGTSCRACGYYGTIPVVNDRTAAYILKNPPPKQAPVAAPAAAAAAATESDQAIIGISKKAGDDDDDEDWGEDTNEDAVRKRMDELSSGAKCLMLNDDLEKSQEDRMQIFFEFVSNKAKTEDITLEENQKAIKAEAERLDISDKAPLILCEVLLQNNDIEKHIITYRDLFLKFTHTNHKAQVYLLRGIALTITELKESLMPRVQKILNALYQKDIVDEEVILEWYEKGRKNKSNKMDKVLLEIFDQATKFVDWLKTAEEETDDEEEDDDDKVDIDFDDRIVGNAIKVEEESRDAKNVQKIGSKDSPNKTKPANNTEPVEDDIDIDAI